VVGGDPDPWTPCVLFVQKLNELKFKARDYSDACQMMACLYKDRKLVKVKAFYDELGAFCDAQDPEKELQVKLYARKSGGDE